MNSHIYRNISNYSEKKALQNNDSFLYNPRERFISILNHLYKKKGEDLVILSKLKEKKKKSYIYELKHYNESDINKITKDMGATEREFLSRVNEFKADIISFENKKNKNKRNFKKVKKDNDSFSVMYEHLLEIRKKKGKNIFKDNKYFIDIANKYLFRKFRLPDLSRNIFNPNPLILEPEENKKYFKNNKVDEDKFLNFLERMKDLTFRKITGDYRISVEERKRLDDIIKNERPKGYIPPEELIPILQEDISKTQNTYNNLINEYKSKTIEEPSNKKPIIINRASLCDINKLNIMKKIKLIRNNNNKIIYNRNPKNNKSNNTLIDNRNKSNATFNINNSSIEITTIPINKNNILNRTNSQMMTLVSPLREKLQNKTLRDIDVFKNDLEDKPNKNIQNGFDSLLNIRDRKSEKNLFKKSYDLSKNDSEDRSNKNFQKDLDPLFYFKIGKISKKLLKGSFTTNNPMIDKEFNLNNSSLLQSNKSELIIPRKKVGFHELISNNHIELDKEKREHLEDSHLNKTFQMNMKKENESNIFVNKQLNNNNKETPDKSDLKTEKDFFEKKLENNDKKNYESQKELENENSLKIEKLYHKALNLKLKPKSLIDEYELENYLISSRGNKSLNELVDLRNTYNNIAKIGKNFFRKNIIKEEYSLRNKEGNKKIEFTEQQKKILDKNNIITKDFIQRLNQFQKIIFEREKIGNK